jgi:hypothetical protein
MTTGIRETPAPDWQEDAAHLGDAEEHRGAAPARWDSVPQS